MVNCDCVATLQGFMDAFLAQEAILPPASESEGILAFPGGKIASLIWSDILQEAIPESDIEIDDELEPEAENYETYENDHDADPDFKMEDDDEYPKHKPTIKRKIIASASAPAKKKGKNHNSKIKKSQRVLTEGNTRCFYSDCSAFFRKTVHLDAHVRKVHEKDSTPYHCPQCDFKFKHIETLSRHRRDAHGLQLKTYTCPHCERTYRSRQMFKNHMSEFHPETPARVQRCSTCTKSFDSLDLLEEHIKLHTGIRTSDQPFSCVICNIYCTGILELQAHVFKDHEESSLKCPREECGRAFLTKTRLRYHIRMHHTSRDRSYLVCPECSYQSTAPSALKKHMLKHAPAKPTLTCDREGCGKVFSYKNTLNRHKKLDHDRDPASLYKCTLCPKAFKQSSSLTTHQAHHSTLRPFLCEHCPFSFKTLHNLKSHYKVHKASNVGQRRSVMSKPRRARLPAVLDSDFGLRPEVPVALEEERLEPAKEFPSLDDDMKREEDPFSVIVGFESYSGEPFLQ